MNPSPGQRPGQHQQHNQAATGGAVYATQNGNLYNTTNNNTTHNQNHHVTNLNIKRSRTKIGWAILIILAGDVGFFFYGQAAYTGGMNNSGDMWRAGIFLALLIITSSLIRRWFRSG
jgi:predicted outer membrane repeat protein